MGGETFFNELVILVENIGLRYGLLEEEWPRRYLYVCAAHVKLVPFAA